MPIVVLSLPLLILGVKKNPSGELGTKFFARESTFFRKVRPLVHGVLVVCCPLALNEVFI